MTERFSNFKREVGDIFRGLFSKLTPRQGKSLSLIVSLVVALFFLFTATGKSVIVLVGYLVFLYVALLYGYKLYKFASTYSVATHKTSPQEIIEDDEDSLDSDFANADNTDPQKPDGDDEKVHQVTMEEIASTIDSQEIV